jgi:hypothetical protein
MSGYHGFEGMDVPKDKPVTDAPPATAEKKCEGDNCDVTEGAEGQAKPVDDIKKLLKSQ